MLRGKMFVVFYNDLGVQVERYLLDPALGNYGVQIPAGQWHIIEVIEPSAIFEVKDGPYTPLQSEDMLDLNINYYEDMSNWCGRIHRPCCFQTVTGQG